MTARDEMVEIAEIRAQILQLRAEIEVLYAIENQRHVDRNQQKQRGQSEEEQKKQCLGSKLHKGTRTGFQQQDICWKG